MRQGNRIQFRLTHWLFITVCIPISYISKGRQRLCPRGLVICTEGDWQQHGSHDEGRCPFDGGGTRLTLCVGCEVR